MIKNVNSDTSPPFIERYLIYLDCEFLTGIAASLNPLPFAQRLQRLNKNSQRNVSD